MLTQILFSGLAIGSIYGLVALGFAVIFKATEVFNFAQGMLVVCGAYLAVTAISQLQLPFPVAVLFIVGAAALLGVVIQALLIRPLAGRPLLPVIGADRFLSTCAKRAPGKCDSAYALAPNCGLIKSWRQSNTTTSGRWMICSNCATEISLV